MHFCGENDRSFDWSNIVNKYDDVGWHMGVVIGGQGTMGSA